MYIEPVAQKPGKLPTSKYNYYQRLYDKTAM